MTADVLASIDGALRDYETSGDAMRWSPGRVICDGGKPLRIGRTSDAAVLYGVARIFSSGEAVNSMAALEYQFQVLGQAMQSAFVPMIKAACEAAHSFDLALRPALHRRTCPLCRPPSRSAALRVNGHEYRRRQRNRRKQRR